MLLLPIRENLMEIHGIPIKSLWTLIAWLPGAMLRRYFPKSRLANLIYVDLRPRHDPATVNLGEVASFDIWLHVINLSPFEVELDRGCFRLWYGGTNVSISIMKRQIIVPGQTLALHLSDILPGGMANQISKTYQTNDAAIDGYIEFNCKLHAFCKEIPHLDGIKPRVLNANFRQAQNVETAPFVHNM
jgi:hypothetical protein